MGIPRDSLGCHSLTDMNKLFFLYQDTLVSYWWF